MSSSLDSLFESRAGGSLFDPFPSARAGLFGRRQRHAGGSRIPVTILTGFLGAGKTTLLQKFLARPEGRGTAVIVNEFGAVGIDDALVRASSDDTVLLGNGCMCCIGRSDLALAMRALVADRERAVIPPFARIVVETSGLADPGPILGTFATDRALGSEFHLEAVVALVDAYAGGDALQWSSEARKQVILADRVILTKSDLVTPAEADAVKDRIRDLNRHAELIVASHGDVAAEVVTAASDSREPISSFHADAVHSDGIRSFVLREQQPVRWEPFSRAVDALLALRGADVLRAKGFLNVTGCEGPVLVQVVQHLAHPPIELRAWPDGERGSRIVFITRNLPEAPVQALFRAMQGLQPD